MFIEDKLKRLKKAEIIFEVKFDFENFMQLAE